jgi:A/G-specific adenine glycosylase
LTFSHKILDWYSTEARDLPWRKPNNTPYKVVLSEFMLQQTQVPRVIEKFHEFLRLFPTIQDLAKAPQADVIKAWSGLGYNRRALLLHKFAQAVCGQSGIIPSDTEELIKLPGIGPYTSGSIASFAFNKSSPAIDVNVRRIYLRYFRGKDQGLPGNKEEEKAVYNLVLQSIPEGKSCDLHNALMDFGSSTCTRNNPQCGDCFLSSSCKFAPLYEKDKKVMYVMEKKKEKGVSEFGKHVPNRIFRGRIVEWVRQNEGKEISLRDLGNDIKKDYGDEKEWLLMLIDNLQRDNLINFELKKETIIMKIAN